jgi:hypothetical protein
MKCEFLLLRFLFYLKKIKVENVSLEEIVPIFCYNREFDFVHFYDAIKKSKRKKFSCFSSPLRMKFTTFRTFALTIIPSER